MMFVTTEDFYKSTPSIHDGKVILRALELEAINMITSFRCNGYWAKYLRSIY
jgi:hypothetical protein